MLYFCASSRLCVLYSDEEKGRLEEIVLACLRCGESTVLEQIVNKILDRRKLIDWKVRRLCSLYLNKK